jgi:hypothetical protein
MACVLALGACAGSGNTVDEGGGESRLSLKEGSTLEGPACSVEEPGCPEGSTCAFLDLETGPRSQCVNVQDVCDRLQCRTGQCVIQESFPVRIRCAR